MAAKMKKGLVADMFRKTSSERERFRIRAMRGRRPTRHNAGLSSVLLFGLVLLSLILLVLGKSENRQLALLRAKALDLTAPALELTTIPAGYIQRSIDRVRGFYDINRKLGELQLENRRLRDIKWNLERLERNNIKLKALLNSAQEPSLKFVSGRIISGNPGLFGQHMLLNVGRRNGIHSGFAVINAQGFIGRTVATGNRTSRILLLTDKSSRVPVSIGKEAIRGVATGTGSALPQIEFLPQNTPIYEGDFVFTSGHGGDLPKGLRIGVVKKIGKRYHIALSARFEGTEYVSVLYYQQSGLAQKP